MPYGLTWADPRPGSGRLVPAGLFEFGHLATTILRATDPGGHLIDRVSPPRPVFAAAAAVYVGRYTLFALSVHAWPVLLVGFAAAGVGEWVAADGGGCFHRPAGNAARVKRTAVCLTAGYPRCGARPGGVDNRGQQAMRLASTAHRR